MAGLSGLRDFGLSGRCFCHKHLNFGLTPFPSYSGCVVMNRNQHFCPEVFALFFCYHIFRNAIRLPLISSLKSLVVVGHRNPISS